jgi:DNA-directed DNA polymerase III PolC
MYLNTHTYYSLRYGVFDAHTLVKLAQENSVSSLALTDINTTSACMNFIREARKCGVKPVVGADVRDGVQQRFILIAQNNDGFQRINHYLTTILLKKKAELHTAPELENVWTIYPYVKGETRTLRENEFIGVRPENIPSVRLQKCPTDKMVILQPVTFRSKKDFNAHRLLRAIDLNTLLSKLPTSEQALPSDQMLPLGRLIQLFEGYPEIIRNTRRILEESEIDFDFSDDREPQNQKTYTSSEEEDMELLLKLCRKGIKYRYPVATEEIFNRISRELDTIKKMGFVSYFLMNWDIVNYARSKGYFYVGRGSGANSVVAYLLRITDVDPIELDLYFERFINLYRKNPPDFDIDFSWKDRDDVTRYIFERFDNVALVGTFNTFQRRAVLRELGKVFGVPKAEIDALTREVPAQHSLDKHTVDASKQTHLINLVVKYADYIHGFPSHLSVHASGILISEKPISYFSATFLPPKGYPTTHIDMHISEDVGLYKFDILSQRGLSKIKDTLEIIRHTRKDQKEIDIHDIQRFKSDERIKHMLRNAEAVGCFYVESPAMRMLLRKLQVDDYLGLVAASSVIRPGVSKSGMMHEYIERFRHPEKRKEANPVMLDLMPETFGVMVYQEDVIKVAYHFAGLTLGEADKMRRGMSGKFRSREEFQAVKDKFFKNCVEVKGHSLELTTEVWRQTESFAGYAFAKGHSASYAVESYQCLFLKAYFPLEFMVATINNYGGFYSTELYVHEARRLGGITLPPCVNNSQWATTISGNKIYLGFHLIKSFDSRMGMKITEERIQNGPFENLNDFLERVPIGVEQLILLVRMDAFRFTGKDKRTLLWEAHMKASKSKSLSAPRDLFRLAPKEYEIPAFSHSKEEAIFDQMELLNFPLFSPFTIVRPDPTPFVLAKDLHRFENQNVWIKGYLIHAKKTRTSKGERMFFGTFLDEKGEWMDTVHFPKVSVQFPFRGRGVYKVYGTVLVEYDCTNVQVISMEKMSIIEDPRYSEVQESKEVVTNNRRTQAWSRSNIAQAELKERRESQTFN